MAEEKIFPSGFNIKPPRDTAPDWVKGSISIKVEDFVSFLNDNEKKGWVNLEMKMSKAGNLYCELDTWEPSKKEEAEPQAKEEEDVF